jgi:pyridoxine/pyridoxamine 5'-phosphate oxidase
MNRSPKEPFMPFAAPSGSLPDSLADVLDSVWEAIERGVRERWTPWGLPILGVNDRNGTPTTRVIALRGFDRDMRALLFHTDGRSEKVTALGASSRASVLFWSPDDAVQVRLAGDAKVHREDSIKHEAWKQASPLSKSAGAIALAPGTPLTRPTPFANLVQEGDAKRSLAHFTAITFVADTVDWLWLGADDLRRARFQRIGASWTGSWIVP